MAFKNKNYNRSPEAHSSKNNQESSYNYNTFVNADPTKQNTASHQTHSVEQNEKKQKNNKKTLLKRMLSIILICSELRVMLLVFISSKISSILWIIV